MASRLKNPFPQELRLAPDGCMYHANPDWLAFEGLSPQGQTQFLARLSLGLTPKPPAMVLDGKPISQHWRNSKSFKDELMRACRFVTRGGVMLAEFWADRAFGEHPEIDEGDRRAYTELLARYARYPTAAPVDASGKTEGQVLGETLYDILQAARQRQALPGASVDGEVREVPAIQERVDDPSARS